MRINKFIAQATDLSRRAADAAITAGRVSINSQLAENGSQVEPTDTVLLDGVKLTPRSTHTTLILNKPIGYVCSRDGQGSATIYDLLPPRLHYLKSVGRLDKDSSGLLLMTDDGVLAEQLTHPRNQKTKIYVVKLDHPLQPLSRQILCDHGIMLEDGRSQLQLERIIDGDDTQWRVIMHEGRNRQIRRTFAALGCIVQSLHRTHFGPYKLDDLSLGHYLIIDT